MGAGLAIKGWTVATLEYPQAPLLSSRPRSLAGGSSWSRTSRRGRACCAPGSAPAGSRTSSCATMSYCWATTACTCAAPWCGGACSRLWGQNRPRKTEAWAGTGWDGEKRPPGCACAPLHGLRRDPPSPAPQNPEGERAWPPQEGGGAGSRGVDTVSLIIKNDLVQKPFLSAKSWWGVVGGGGR